MFYVCTGLLSVEEFGQLSSDAFQRFLYQRGVNRNQLVRNSRHTWLYQGQGEHQVLRDLRNRYPSVSLCNLLPTFSFKKKKSFYLLI